LQKKAIDVVVIHTHGRKDISHLFIGKNGEDMANHANFPVLKFKIR